ncbi:MAG TPA: universal stress protein [Xanthobacteraceae bacterium]|jgi:nucleotide-binding universal stress UspA family protein
MLKDVIVNLDVHTSQNVAADFAISVARTFQAHLSAVGFAYEPSIPGSLFDHGAVEFIEMQRQRWENAARSAIGRFEEAARGSGLSVESHLVRSGNGRAAETFARLARRFDLAVLTQAEPEKASARALIIEAALFESGRPVLVVPYVQRDGLKLGRALVCWDGSRTAARALGDAMAFLQRAQEVQVVIVASEPGKSDEIPGADIAHHLARHGLKVELKQIVVRDLDVASTILSHAADVAADFIVMGGYGHSRLREFVLGGATRGLLAAMTVPTMMSH